MSMLTIMFVVMLQWTPSTDHRDARVILEGHWQSCRQVLGAPTDLDGYDERVYEHVVWVGDGRHHVAWQLHLGPKNEFAVFRGDPADHPNHDAAGNLLSGYKYDAIQPLIGGRTWQFTVERHTYRLNVIEAGGSRDECESYWIKLERVEWH